MITDSARQKLIPSLAEVLAALKTVPPAYTYAPRELQVQVSDNRDDVRAIGSTVSKTLQTPVIRLQSVRMVDQHGRESETWSVVSMPEFHL